MAGRLTEEQVTKSILNWLEKNGWKIICFDFPQSGTGVVLHPNSDIRESTKNKGGIIPDIVAVKNNVAVFFENKDRFVYGDFEKIHELRNGTNYSSALNSLFKNYQINSIFYGIGMPYQIKDEKKNNDCLQMTDFIIFVENDRKIRIGFQAENIFTD